MREGPSGYVATSRQTLDAGCSEYSTLIMLISSIVAGMFHPWVVSTDAMSPSTTYITLGSAFLHGGTGVEHSSAANKRGQRDS